MQKEEQEVKISSVVSMLNNVLEMDREGISRHFFNTTIVDSRIAETPVELFFIGDPNFATLTPVGMINSVLRLLTDHRIVAVMRNPYLIERFDYIFCGDEHVHSD